MNRRGKTRSIWNDKLHKPRTRRPRPQPRNDRRMRIVRRPADHSHRPDGILVRVLGTLHKRTFKLNR